MLSNTLMLTKHQIINEYDTSTKLIRDQKICYFLNRRTEKLDLEIGGLKVQKYVTRGIKIAFKPLKYRANHVFVSHKMIQVNCNNQPTKNLTWHNIA